MAAAGLQWGERKQLLVPQVDHSGAARCCTQAVYGPASDSGILLVLDVRVTGRGTESVNACFSA